LTRLQIGLVLALLSLAGCLRDQEQAVAQCRSARPSALTSSTSISDDNSQIELCMKAAGYEPDRTQEDCRAMDGSVAGLTARCYEPASFFGWLTWKTELVWNGQQR
jgi:hypothetical protein